MLTFCTQQKAVARHHSTGKGRNPLG